MNPLWSGLANWLPPDELLIQKEALSFSTKKLSPNQRLWFGSLVSGVTPYWIWDDSKLAVRYREGRLRSIIPTLFKIELGIRDYYRPPTKAASKRISTNRIERSDDPNLAHKNYQTTPPTVQSYDWFLFDRVVKELVDQGFKRVGVGHYVKGDQEAWTCKHKWIEDKFCVMVRAQQEHHSA